jgi:hypothetical protein
MIAFLNMKKGQKIILNLNPNKILLFQMKKCESTKIQVLMKIVKINAKNVPRLVKSY